MLTNQGTKQGRKTRNPVETLGSTPANPPTMTSMSLCVSVAAMRKHVAFLEAVHEDPLNDNCALFVDRAVFFVERPSQQATQSPQLPWLQTLCLCLRL